MTENVKKQHILEMLYDNGITESFPTGELTENELQKLLSTPYLVFRDGVNGVLQLNGMDGETVLVQAKKIVRLSAKEMKEFN